MARLIRAFRNFAEAPKNSEHVFSLSLSVYMEPLEGMQVFISYSKKINLILILVPIFVVHLYLQADPEPKNPKYLAHSIHQSPEAIQQQR